MDAGAVASSAATGVRHRSDGPPAVRALLADGYAALPLADEAERAVARAFAEGRRFFALAEGERRAVAWPGWGRWCGYQPVPAGDAAVLDLVERFEAPMSALAPGGTAAPIWHPRRRGLRPALIDVMDLAVRSWREVLEGLALARGFDPSAAHQLWLADHDSTVVVNHYPPDPAQQLVMKPHRDFGGLSAVFLEAGGSGHLEFAGSDGWDRWHPDAGRSSCCLVVGELLAGWLDCPAPVHRVRSTGEERLSLVAFHQPANGRLVPQATGSAVVAGEHIQARQDHYNRLG